MERRSEAEATYQLLREAVLRRQNVGGWYRGLWRELSPHVLGLKRGAQHVYSYQFGGGSHHGLKKDGSRADYRCMRVAQLVDLRITGGDWHTAKDGPQHEFCIDDIDVTVEFPEAA